MDVDAAALLHIKKEGFVPHTQPYTQMSLDANQPMQVEDINEYKEI